MRTHFHTNLDLPHCEKWPTDLPAIPRVGDWIQSSHSWPATDSFGDFRLELKVVAVRWVYVELREDWITEIELHTDKSVNDFYHWYAPLIGQRAGAFI